MAVGCGGGGSKPKQGDLAAVGTPIGKVEDKEVRVIVAFSKPMVAKDAVDKPLAKLPVSITPDLGGEAKWTDEKTLVVVPTKSLPVSTKFTASVPGDTKALDGSVLGKPHTFEFFTERLTGVVELIGPSKQHATKDQIVKIAFNQEVDWKAVEASCGFDGAGKHVGIKLAPDSGAGPSKSYTVVPAGELALDTEYVASCKQELKGTVGNLGLESKLEDKFKTYGALKYASMEPTGNDIVPDENLSLDIAFSNPLKPPYAITIKPAVPSFPKTCHALSSEKPGVSCSVQLEARTDYTVTVAAEQLDVFGQKLGKAEVITFRTADAQPTISMESGYFVAELKRPVLPIWTRNVTKLDLRIVDITPANFHELRPKLDWWESKPADFAKSKLKPRDKVVAINGEKNKWGQRPIDPATLVGRTTGPGMYYLEIGSAEVKREPFEDGGRKKVLVNFTDIGVVSKLSPTRGLVWVTTLSTGKPLANATVTVRDGAKQTWSGTTDADGIAILPGKDKLVTKRAPANEEEGEFEDDSGGNTMRIFVQNGADFTMVNPEMSGGLSPWSFNVSVDYGGGGERLRGFMHTDRGLYRAGEKVHVKGLARVTKLGEALAAPQEGKDVKVEVYGPQGKLFTSTKAKLSAYGGFWFDLDLPGDARLGDYNIRAQLDAGTFSRSFTVEAYRPATFEVTGKAKEARVVRRGNVTATVSANYLYGAPLRAGEVDVTVHSRPRRIEFDGLSEFQFFDERSYDRYYYGDSEDSQTLVTEDHVALDQKGNGNFSIAVSPDEVTRDADLLVRAAVTSPSNEVINKTFTIPYFHSRKYFGLKASDYFLAVGKPQKFQIVAASPDGKVVDSAAKVTVTRRDWNCVWEDWGYRGNYQCKEDIKNVLQKNLQISGGKPVDFDFTLDKGGSYTIVVEGATDKDEAAPAAMQMYAWGDGGGSWRSDDTLSFDIVANKKEYKAGDTATLLLKTDLAQATGLVTIERDGVVEKRLIEITPTKKHIDVPITDAFAPNMYVSVALVQGRMGDGPRGKPRMRMGLINLPVRPADNKLTVSVETDAKDYRPGANVTATVKVVDKAGNPVAAEVSITAADEGVLSLIGYETPNPVPTFYAPWGLGVTTATQLEYIRDIPGPNTERPATGGDAPGTLRSRFVSTAVWAPNAVTDATGTAKVEFKAPDNLTAFRVMAVAADKATRFGSADKRFTVSKPLQLHAALPRFVNIGDTMKAGVIVHNETGKAGSATVKVVGDKRLTIAGGSERTIQVAKDANVPVLFDMTAAELGETKLQFSVAMNGENDAVEFKLPVQHPSPVLNHHVEHGATKDPKTITLALPPDAIPSTAELLVSVDPDGLSGIENGLEDLIHYPYGCLEQTTSKVIPMLAVRELAESLNLKGLKGPALEHYVREGIAKIGRHQTAYGGFSLWIGGEPEAYYTAYALWGLYLAKQAGYPVDGERIKDGLEYLRNDGQRPNTDKPYYDESGNLGSQAFALYVRAVLGDKDPAAVTTLLAKPELPVYGKAYLARALAAGTKVSDPAVVKIVGELAQLAKDAGKGNKLIEEPKKMYAYMSSSLRTTAMVLDTLVALDPKNEAIKPLVTVLMSQRRQLPYWDTQENLYSLLALTSYAKTITGTPPSVEVALAGKKLWGGKLAGKSRIKVVRVPFAAGELAITPTGGEVQFNVEVVHRKDPKSIKAAANGITLSREYLDESGKAKSTFTVGDVVLVRVQVQLADDYEHFMVSEPLPAGFEALNTRFKTVGSAGIKQSQDWDTFREMYDDRVDFATEWTWKGGATYEFMIRATQAGTFVRPPTTAQRMYEPQTNAHAALDTIEIKAK